MNRKQRRAAQRLARKSGNKDLENKMNLFSSMSESCNACEKTFDKKDEKMVNEWTVIVREDEKETRLYCPGCWSKAKKLIEKVKQEDAKLQL
tara:strand:- start:1243 stop:1518 length:276 start_codon:yes stop_codon:yes gene_type:complete